MTWVATKDIEPWRLVLGMWCWRGPDGKVNHHCAVAKKIGSVWYAFSAGITRREPMFVTDAGEMENFGSPEFPAMPPLPADFWTSDDYVWVQGPFE